MNAKDIIELNNELREQLNKENLAAYEDMLTYIRLSSNKSEQQTEEVLLELLEHLLEAQKSGKTAKDIFGEDIKQYCDELINEIPGEKSQKHEILVLYRITIFGCYNPDVWIVEFPFALLFPAGGELSPFSIRNRCNCHPSRSRFVLPFSPLHLSMDEEQQF